LALVTVLW